MDTAAVLGFPVHPVTEASALEAAQKALVSGNGNLHVVTLNPEMLMQGEADPVLGNILKTAGLILPDGVGVVWALRRQGMSVERLPGIEFSDRLLQYAAAQGVPVALVGAAPEILVQTVAALSQRLPGLKVVYAHHGYFSAEEASGIARTCAESGAKIVFAALGVPRQEKWLAEHSHLFTGAILIGVGGSFDVWSGSKQRAPEIFRKLHLEWLYRITSEPWRFKRILTTLPIFVVKVLMSKASPPQNR